MKSDLAVDGFGYWLAGFIDGEGCFGIYSKRSPSGSVRYWPSFNISLRDDDAEILLSILDRTGLGSVAFTRRNAPEWGDVATWRIRKRADLVSLCEILDRFPLRAKKQVDFEIWREAVHVWTRVKRAGNLPVNTAIWDRLGELRSMLSDARVYEAAA